MQSEKNILMDEKAKKLLKEQILKLDNRSIDIEGWKSSTIIILESIFNENHSSINAIKSINRKIYDTTAIGGYRSDSFDQCVSQGKAILEACINVSESIGIHEKKEYANSGININLTQNQVVNISVLYSVLEDELNRSQLQELIELLKTNENKRLKKNRIVEKLASFGSDVTSNILANILTNPNIWNQL